METKDNIQTDSGNIKANKIVKLTNTLNNEAINEKKIFSNEHILNNISNNKNFWLNKFIEKEKQLHSKNDNLKKKHLELKLQKEKLVLNLSNITNELEKLEETEIEYDNFDLKSININNNKLKKEIDKKKDIVNKFIEDVS